MIIASRSNRRGFTLTEIAIVLGIIGFILGGVWVAAGAVYNNMRIFRASQELLQIAQQVRSLYATQALIDSAVTTNTFIHAGIFPADMVDNGTSSTRVYDPWRQTVTVERTISSDGTPGDAFVVSFNGVPQPACITFLVGATGSSRDQSMIAAGVGDIVASNDFAPVNASSAAASCTSLTSNTVTFMFRLKG